MSRSSWIHWSVLAGLLVCVGCGEKAGVSGTVPVTGLVMLDGKPVAGASVTFSPTGKGGRAAVGTTDAEGRYTLTTMKPGDGAIPGSYNVAISKTVAGAAAGAPAEDPRSSGGKLTPEQMKSMMDAMKNAGKNADAESELPSKYATAATSGFTATVAAGQTNDFPFAMAK
ncbi:MAG: hypothetical protein ACYC3X_31290 [Pirellulaceae bacterium]